MTVKNLSDKSVAVHVDGKLHHVLPGDVFPESAVVENPNVLGDQKLPDATRQHYRDKIGELEGYNNPRIGRLRAEYQKIIDDDDNRGGADDDGDGGPPPQAGRGSGIDAWRDYALENEVDVQEDWTRDQIIDELKAAGKPV